MINKKKIFKIKNPNDNRTHLEEEIFSIAVFHHKHNSHHIIFKSLILNNKRKSCLKIQQEQTKNKQNNK